MDDTIRVAILCGDEVIAATDDEGAVNVSAAMVAAKLREPRTAMLPVAEGRRQALQQIALGIF
jgi:hypothetical protein